MKTQNILFNAAILLFVMSSACKKDKSPEVIGTNPNAVSFSSSINGQVKTKAVNDSWEANDAIGVFMKTGAGLSNILSGNKSYNTTGDGEFKPVSAAQTIYYPEDGTAVDFIAYYPFVQSLSGTKYAVDVNNQTNQSAIDLLYANNAIGLSKTNTNASLVFNHQLSKVEFTVKKGSGITDLNGLTTSISGLKTKADFDLAAGVLSNQAQIADVVAKTGMRDLNVVSEGIILPTADAAGAVVTFTLPTGKFKFTLPANTKFEQGKKYSYNIELKNDGTGNPVAIGLTAVITNWSDVPSGSHVIDQDGGTENPPVGTETVLYTETFGVGSASNKPKINAYTGWVNTALTFSDAYGTTDVRTISAYPDNIHGWLPANKDASLKIEGIKISGYTKLKLKYDLAPNASSTSSTSDFNVISVKVNGVVITVPSNPITFANNNKFTTLELNNITPLADNTIEFFGAAGLNNLGMRIDNVTIIGLK